MTDACSIYKLLVMLLHVSDVKHSPRSSEGVFKSLGRSGAGGGVVNVIISCVSHFRSMVVIGFLTLAK